MKIIKLTRSNQKQVIDLAGRVLKSRGLIVYPTETMYGLGADPFDQRAIERVIQIKGRLATKGIQVVVYNRAQLDTVARVSPEDEEAMKKYWPGPLALVFPKTDLVPKLLTGGRDTIAARKPKHAFVLALLKKYGRPIISTSANLSGHPPCFSVKEVIAQFEKAHDQPDLIIDGGKLKPSPPSTIVQVVKGRLVVLRAGAIKISAQNV
ncbi:MAG: L-threonylcarbamoyladenylate synthase [Patescibacteria group bacterium]|nr:L-threonylcarbamoyladenylate synthase [Patescibacteria group bacterium]